jgi:putative restriction endonuclease
MTKLEASVIKAYLCEGWSHRKIQETILGIEAPVRGGGYEAMRILHKYGITGEYKACLKGKPFDPKVFDAAGNIQNYLRSN